MFTLLLSHMYDPVLRRQKILSHTRKNTSLCFYIFLCSILTTITCLGCLELVSLLVEEYLTISGVIDEKRLSFYISKIFVSLNSYDIIFMWRIVFFYIFFLSINRRRIFSENYELFHNQLAFVIQAYLKSEICWQ